MSGAPTIWMNVTTSANWQRPPVGIVRVEQALKTELSRLYGSRFKTCIWEHDKFVEYHEENKDIDGTASAENNEGIDHSQIEQQAQLQIKPDLPYIYPLLPRMDALVAVAQGLLSLMPDRLRPHINSFLYWLRPRLTRFIAGVGRATDAGNKATSSFDRSLRIENCKLMSPFLKGDIFISVGLDWNYSYYKELYALRNSMDVKVITCCYDLIPVIYPQYCVNDVAGVFTSYFLEIADASDLILCISRQSEKDLNQMLETTGGARPPTLVFPLGDNVPRSRGESLSEEVQEICRQPFILYVSTVERRKNHETLYRAYHLLCQQGKRSSLPRLIFVGMRGWGVEELLKDIELDPLTRGLIIHLNHVNDSELRLLYDSALFCVFPSLYEGWGLPVGEALALGKVVICSNRGSLPEVGGDLVRYIDPWDVSEWAREIYLMSTDEFWRKKCEDRVKNEYSPRAWHDAGNIVKNAIDRLENAISPRCEAC